MNYIKFSIIIEGKGVCPFKYSFVLAPLGITSLSEGYTPLMVFGYLLSPSGVFFGESRSVKKLIMTIVVNLMLIFLCFQPGQAGPTEEGMEPENNVFKAMVVRVIDGDSIVIRVNRENRTIALYGIDCPENSQAYGNAARYWVNMLVFHEEVKVRVIPPDNYSETPALIYFGDDRCLNQELVMAGLAWVDERNCRRPECIRWLEGEKKARNTGVGLWKEKDPTPPWQWRETQSR